jgi:hypothetical protein
MAVRRSHFKDTILVTKNFSRIHDFDGAVDGLDHGAPTLQLSRLGKAINREYRVRYNTQFDVFLAIERKGVMRQSLGKPSSRQPSLPSGLFRGNGHFSRQTPLPASQKASFYRQSCK